MLNDAKIEYNRDIDKRLRPQNIVRTILPHVYFVFGQPPSDLYTENSYLSSNGVRSWYFIFRWYDKN